jgi:hypothetical protein
MRASDVVSRRCQCGSAGQANVQTLLARSAIGIACAQRSRGPARALHASVARWRFGSTCCVEAAAYEAAELLETSAERAVVARPAALVLRLAATVQPPEVAQDDDVTRSTIQVTGAVTGISRP